ncbi:MAG: hemerythrin family protein [Thiotrichaceae bacterium]|nr:hemerythrin family protein [Thiotrichaceae bacterium]
MFKSIGTFGIVLLMITALILVALGFSTMGIAHPLPWIMLIVVAAIPFIHNKMSAKRYLVWDDAYSVGVEEMDNDHKKLINLINQLQTSVDYYTGKEFELKALDELVDYTKTHFKKEEKLLEESDYADLASHKIQHTQFIEKINQAAEDYKNNADATIVDTLKFLREWLINHINGTDKEYTQTLNNKGIH